MTSFWDLPTDLNARVMELEQKIQSDRDRITGNPNVRYSNQNPQAARRLQQKAAMDSVSVPSGDGCGEPEPDAPQWGAPVSGCLPGVFAVVYTETEEGDKAVDVVRVKSFAAGQTKGEEKFTGELFTPAHFSTAEAGCLKGKWNPPRTGCELVTNYCYCVLLYFSKMNSGGKLPKKVVDEIWAIVHTQQLDLFVRANDEQLSAHSESDGSDSDDDAIGSTGTIEEGKQASKNSKRISGRKRLRQL
jgi:hypothetical protein